MKNQPTPKATLRHLPELDSLRTIAVLMTLLAHFAPVEIPYMWYGVPVFFTISGFLITTILLNSVNNNPGVSKLTVIKNFMIRRALRLFPIYYLFLIVFWLLRHHLFLWKDDYALYFFTYTPNFLIYKTSAAYAGCFAHLWSLGIEEQFYLVWPWLMLFSPAKWRMPVVIGMILLSIGLIFFNHSSEAIRALPFTHLHTLGVGALLACFYVKGNGIIAWLMEKRHWLFWVSFFHLVVVLIFFKEDIALWHLYREVSLCVCTFFIVNMSVFGWKGVMGYFTRNKQVQYVGAISYGLYLFHMPVPFVFKAVTGKLLPSLTIPPFAFMFVCLGLTFVLAALSYRFIESPILKLKRFFA